jgi:subfamily B ATP-binding cassette protein MsbA
MMTPPSHSSKALLGRLWRDYIRGYRGRMVLAGICMILAAGATAANAWLMQPVLDDIFMKQDESMLTLIPLAVLTIFTVKALATYGQTVLLNTLGQRIVATMQQHLYRHLLYADISLFADQASGRLISRFTNDIYLLRASVSTLFTGVIKELLTLIFLLAVMFYQSWSLSLITLIVFPLSAWPVMRLGKRMRRISNATQEGISEFAGKLDETFAGVRVVKAYGKEEDEIRHATSHIEGLYKLYRKAVKVQAAASPMMELFTGCAIAAVIAYGGAEVMEGTTSPGAFFSFITAMIMAYKPAKTLAGFNTQFQEGMAAAARLFSVLDTKAAVQNAPDAQPLRITDAHIHMDNVSFHYAGGQGVHGLSLEIPSGKTVALVGPSGGGKSTLMNLLMRFYDAQSGSITLDGQPIEKVTLNSLRESIAFVAQETVLFDDSIANNIAYGNPNANQQAIEEAAKAAAAHEFIEDLAEGYATRVGPRGVKLSGGQRQRLAIARALLKDAPILLLDEATSALDTASEQKVQQAIATLMQGRTTLVIAHRLSTIRHADYIYVLDKGKISEAGTPEALLKKEGLFHRLYKLQQNIG